MNECLKNQKRFPVFYSERITTFRAGSQFHVKIWPALRKGRGWPSFQRTSNTIGTTWGKENYDNGHYNDEGDDDDDNDEDVDYNVFSSSQRTSNRIGTKGGDKLWWWCEIDDDEIVDNYNNDDADDDEDDDIYGNVVFFFSKNLVVGIQYLKLL